MAELPVDVMHARQRFAAEVTRRRTEAGLSLADVAGRVHVARSYVHNIASGQRWPSPAIVAALDQALGADGTLLAAWELGAVRRARNYHRPVVSPIVPQASDLVGQDTAGRSARILAFAEFSNVGELTMEQLHSDVRRIARSYLKVPTMPLLSRTGALLNRAMELLAGRQRPQHTRDLYAVAGWALTLLAWMSVDLGWPESAEDHARAAWACAVNSDHLGLRGWVRATQHTAAFWQNDFERAADFAAEGLRYATGTAAAFLSSAYAMDLARIGRHRSADAALRQAWDIAERTEPEPDELGGPLTCTVGRAGSLWTDTHVALGQAGPALTIADQAIRDFEATPEPERNPGSERMLRLELVRAHLIEGELDGAVTSLAPVLDTPTEHRVRPLLKRLREIAETLARSEHRDTARLIALRGEIAAFERSAITRPPLDRRVDWSTPHA
jgi:transcriptional regulator with XRE-family HTH domain